MRRNSSDVTRREVLRRFGLAAGFAALEPGCVASRPSGPGAAIKVVVVTDLTGPIGFAGPLNANIAKLVVDDITAGGGLLGRPLNLIVVDSASDPAIGVAKARVRGTYITNGGTGKLRGIKGLARYTGLLELPAEGKATRNEVSAEGEYWFDNR